MDIKNLKFNRDPNIKWWLSIPIIILTIIIFWPVGVVLLIWRIAVDKRAALLYSGIITLAGIFFLLMAVAGFFIVAESDFTDNASIVLTIGLTLLAVTLIWLGIKTRNQAHLYKRYIGLIANDHKTSIDQIASAMSLKYDTVRKDLQKMINKDYFTGAHIDDSTRSIELANKKILKNENITSHTSSNVVTNSKTYTVSGDEMPKEFWDGMNNMMNGIFSGQMSNTQTTTQPKEKQLTNVDCKSCGAKQELFEGTTGRCEFCGSIIKAS
jgi:ribosomal protein S27E